MSQKEFSEYLGLPQSTLSSYESGKMSPSLSMTFRIAKKCNVTMDWLCGNDKKTKVESIADIAEFFFELFEHIPLVIDDFFKHGDNKSH